MPVSPRVVFLTDLPPPRTGQSLISETFLRRLRDRGMDVRHLPLTGATGLRPGKARKIWLFLLNLVRLARSVRGGTHDSFDTVYLVCPSTTGGAIANLLVASLCPRRTRIVMHVHNGDFDRLFRAGRRIVGWLIGRVVDTVVFSSPDLATRVPLPQSQKAHVSNPIGRDLEAALGLSQTAARTDGDRASLTVGFLSNFIPEKGYEVLAEAVLQFRRRGRDVELEMWGAWPNSEARTRFLALLDSDPLGAACVHVHPTLTTAVGVAAALQSIDVLVLPTTYRREAHPLSIIEAFAAGVPVIASRHASIPSMVRDGDTGFLVSVPPSYNEIAERLEALLAADRSAMSRAARWAFETNHSPDALTDRLAAILAGPLTDGKR